MTMYEHYKDKWLISELVETIGEFCLEHGVTKEEATRLIARLSNKSPEWMAVAETSYHNHRDFLGRED